MENTAIQDIISTIEAKFSNCAIITDNYGMTNIVCARESIIDLVGHLKHDLGFGFLTDICGAHYPLSENQEFQVVYHIHNLYKNVRLRLKVNLATADLAIPTMVNLFPAANWMERETFDFYGIIFEGHPDLRRILNMDEMNYHPLRKEYALEDAGRDDKEDKYFGR
jgi:NADH-quinone oxidoreductase subunit C